MKCKMNGNEVAMPCVASCPLFGDCVAEYQRTPKAPQPTNADRIRAMSDEELAEYLFEQYNAGWWYGNNDVSKPGLKDAILHQLSQPVEED